MEEKSKNKPCSKVVPNKLFRLKSTRNLDVR